MASSEASLGLGFANLPNQVQRKFAKRGFEFSLMVAGESALGKSTLINCLFMTNINDNLKPTPVSEQLNRALKIVSNTVDIEEKGVKLKLTVVDTPGFGEAIDCSHNFDPILNYIDEQFERYLNHESGLNRRHFSDTRVHCCFYFISPFYFGLKPIDIQFMTLLHEKVNIVPIIAKSDNLTKEEIQTLKKRVLSELKDNNIKIYKIPDCDADEDEDYKEHVRQLKAAIPFAVSASVETHEVKGRKVRGRSFPWGICETDNPEHSDFVKLRSMLVTHMQDLREVTQDVHYENYRTQRLAGKITPNIDIRDNISVMSGDEEKDRILQEKEAELKRMQELIAKMEKEMKQSQTEEIKAQNSTQNLQNNV